MSFLKVVNILNPSNANASIIINTAGNVGIGSSNPAVALDVVGSTNISGNLTVLGIANLGSIGNIAASSITAGTVAISSSAPSINTTTGALTVAGGAGIGGNINAGGTVHSLAGNVTIGSNLSVNGTGISWFNGSVGIGTSLPSYLLQVGSQTNRGIVSVVGTAVSSAQIRLDDTAAAGGKVYSLFSGSSANGNFDIYDSSTSTYRLTITANGNLQIGTTAQTVNPTAVEVINNINGGGTEWVNNNNGGGNVSALSTGGLAFGTFTGAVGSEVVAERMRIDGSGRVLIGTASYALSSTEKFEVNAGAGQSAFINSSDTTATVYLNNQSTTASTNQPYVFFTDQTTSNRGAIGINYTNSALFLNGQGGIYFRYGGTGTGTTEAMRITSSGYVGIGISNPSYNLVVSNAGAEGVEIAPGYAAGKNLFQSYNRSGSSYVQLDSVASVFAWQIAGTEKMRIASGGNILVGTSTAPASGNGTLVINGTGTNAGGAEYVSQNNGGGNVQALSSGGLQWGTFTGSVGSEVYSARLTMGATGILSTYYTSSTGLTTWNTAQNVIGGLHFATAQGSSTSAKAEAAITFGYNNSLTNAQAGVYVTNDVSSGTWMALATTDNYSTGPQIGLSIANTGGVSVPRTWLTVPNQPAWHAYYTGTSDLAIGVGTTTFVYNIASVNNGSNYSTSSGRFTAPVAGTYMVYAQVQYYNIAASPSFTGLYIMKNGSAYVDGYTQSTGYNEPSVRATITLAAGDYLQVVGNYSVASGTSVIQLSAGTRNYFGGYLIG